MEEESKAIQEVAKATGKGIDAARELGGFIARFINGPLEQGVGIFEDKLKYMRWERQIRLMERARKFLLDRGMQGPTRAIPMSFAISLFQAGSLEEDDYLQDRWATLLVNAADASSKVDIRRSYISILEDLIPLDAIMLEKIYHVAVHTGRSLGNSPVLTGNLPEEVVEFHTVESNSPLKRTKPSNEVTLSLLNLIRLGCIAPVYTLANPLESVNKAWLTPLGKALVEACTVTKEEE